MTNELKTIRSYFTFLSRNKAYTFINILGFSLSLMFVVIITFYAHQEYSVDKSIGNAPRIYSVCVEIGDGNGGVQLCEGSHWRVQRVLKKAFPEIEMTCAVASADRSMAGVQGEQVNADVMFADSTFFSMVSIPLVEGDNRSVLCQRNAAVVSEEYARKMFGRKSPVGQKLRFYGDDTGSTQLRVTGVFTTTDGTSFHHADIITRFENVATFNSSLTSEQMQNATGANVLLLTREGSRLESKLPLIDKELKESGFWFYNMPGTSVHTKLLRLSDRYFSPSVSGNAGMGNDDSLRGDAKLVGLLFAVAIVILLFSIINYINLTVAQSAGRAREMATRRLLGAQRSGIMLRLVAESTLLCLVCLVVALALTAVAMPYAARLLSTQLHFAGLFSVANVAIGVAFVLVVGFLSGLLPAIVISRAKPIDVVRGTFRMRNKLWFSKVFIVFQNVITILLMASSIVMVLQVRHLINAPLGYVHDHLLDLPTFGGDAPENAQFVAEVKRLPCVTDASLCCGYMLDGGNNMTTVVNGRSISFQVFRGDENYMRILGLKLLRDNRVPDEDGVYVNRQALAEMGLPLTARSFRLGGGKEDPVVKIRGVLADFTIVDITAPQHPVLLYVQKGLKYPWSVLVKVQGDEAEACKRVAAVWSKVMKADAAQNFDNPYADRQLREHFARERRTATIVTLFAAIAVVISLLGLVAISTYFIEQRRKEIAIRKVFGSTSRQIYVRLVRTFVSYVGIAFAVAVPLVYCFMSRWLSNYNYRISLSWWIYAASGAACLAVSFVAVMAQSRAAADSNPAEGVKAE